MLRKKLLRWLTIGALGVALAGGSFALNQNVGASVQQVADPGGAGGNGG